MGTLESIPEYRNDMQTAHMAVGYPNQSHFAPLAWPAYSLRYAVEPLHKTIDLRMVSSRIKFLHPQNLTHFPKKDKNACPDQIKAEQAYHACILPLAQRD